MKNHEFQQSILRKKYSQLIADEIPEICRFQLEEELKKSLLNRDKKQISIDQGKM